MKIDKKYSHLNAEEYLLVHKPELYQEIIDSVIAVDAEKCKTKVSKEKDKFNSLLYSPGDINKAFERMLSQKGWESVRWNFYVSDNYAIVKTIEPMEYEDQKEYLTVHNQPLFSSCNQTDFVKKRVAIEV